MSNSYFQFKQFKIEQDQCAMKVSTDACIQGAWTPILSHLRSVLDIGTGTGLLSLMLAQRNNALKIDAIEIDAKAAQQASQNIAKTKWANSIHVVNDDVKTYPFQQQYDLIICNPPFFINSLLGYQDERNKARHHLSLSFEDLFKAIQNNMAPQGYAAILLPFTEHQIWKQLVEKNHWNIFHELSIIPRTNSKPNRVVSLCSADISKEFIKEELVIRNEDNHYTSEFTNLLQPFYLNL